jgi:short-subunit dehydrogenase
MAGKAHKADMKPEHVLITGATGAIGAALALEYARPGRRLTLHGRRTDRLGQVAGACHAKGAEVCTRALDLRDRPTMRRWLAEICKTSAPDLVIANAGLNAHIEAGEGWEKAEEAEALVEVNLLAAMTTTDGVLAAMRKRGSGQIALMSSLAARIALPVTPTYCATKAAVKIYGQALRDRLAPEGIRITVIMPGYVASPMCEAMPGPKPFLWTPSRAARHIRRGLERDRAVIAFPCLLNLALWGLSILPSGLAGSIVRWCGYGPGRASFD